MPPAPKDDITAVIEAAVALVNNRYPHLELDSIELNLEDGSKMSIPINKIKYFPKRFLYDPEKKTSYLNPIYDPYNRDVIYPKAEILYAEQKRKEAEAQAKAEAETVADDDGSSPTMTTVVRPSPDFRSIKWYDGRKYSFTTKQAIVLQHLWAAIEEGYEEVGQSHLLEAADSECKHLTDLFRDHPAWGIVIIRGKTSGSYRIAQPNS